MWLIMYYSITERQEMRRSDLTVYLCGKMSGLAKEDMEGWRKYIKKELEKYAILADCNINVISPCDYYNFENPRHQSEEEIMRYDLSLVKNSDIVIANVEGLNTSIGSAIEIYEAWKLGIPIIGYENLQYHLHNKDEKLHPWLQTCITRTEVFSTDLCEYIRDFYMN